MFTITSILFEIILLLLFIIYIVYSYNIYNKAIGNLYKLKSEIYDNFSSGTTQLQYRAYLLNHIDINLSLLKSNKTWKTIFLLHYIKEYILNNLLKFPTTIEQEDIFYFHRKNLSNMSNTPILSLALINTIKQLSRLSSFNYLYYANFFSGKGY